MTVMHTERFRPLYHFTPERNWMNDPNGLVYFDGEYHLFYQYNPHGDTWGHMHWGHAVSRDLVRWQRLPVALEEENSVMIYSGCAVVDWNDTSGFAAGGNIPLVAIYTAHHTDRPLQTQHLAFSVDRGRTWTKYNGNPVLDIDCADYRDPKVFWHGATGRWVMIVSLAVQRKLSFYASSDLKTWSHLSDFGPAGSTTGIWECPDMFPLAVDGNVEERKWVVLLNVNPGAPAGGSGCQYFVGHFDGTRFHAEHTDTLWLDHGADFYAAVSWSDVPAHDGRRLIIGWMNNWLYGNLLPTAPWRGAMTLPRALRLRSTPGGLRLNQDPVDEVKSLRSAPPRSFRGRSDEMAAWLAEQSNLSAAMDVLVELSDFTPATGFRLALECGPGAEIVVGCDGNKSVIWLDRTNSGCVDFDPSFPARHEAPLRRDNDRLHLRLLVDAYSLEVFAQDGESVMTELFFPSAAHRRLALITDGPPPGAVAITIYELNAPQRDRPDHDT